MKKSSSKKEIAKLEKEVKAIRSKRNGIRRKMASATGNAYRTLLREDSKLYEIHSKQQLSLDCMKIRAK